MALTAQQICTLACQMAQQTNATVQAGQLLNVILAELCQDYDFDLATGTTVFPLSSALGSGPYPLPADFLRFLPSEAFYTISGTPYVMVPIDLAEYDALTQTAGVYGYPQSYATDVSLADNATPVMYVWPPSSGAYPFTGRYKRLIPDIASPATSSSVPWFPNQTYLITRLTGELMKIQNNDQWRAYLGNTPEGAQGMLDRYLKLQGDNETRAKTVKLDRRRFGRSYDRLPNTKAIGW